MLSSVFARPKPQMGQWLMRKSAIVFACILAVGLALPVKPASAQGSTTAKAPQSTTSKAPTARKAPAKAATPAAAATQPATLKDQKEKASYALGMNMGDFLRRQSVDIDTNILLQGLKDAMAGKTLLTEEEARGVLMQLQSEMRAKQETKAKEAGEANKKEGEAFLAANKTKEGVVTLPSGLQYKIITQGTGPKPTATDTVSCNYRGTLINGTEFDSSYKRGQPTSFPVNGVIKGWTEALQLMPVGSKWQLFIPADLAYGERSPSELITPNSTLIFEVELVSIAEKPNAEKPKVDQPK